MQYVLSVGNQIFLPDPRNWYICMLGYFETACGDSVLSTNFIHYKMVFGKSKKLPFYSHNKKKNFGEDSRASTTEISKLQIYSYGERIVS